MLPHHPRAQVIETKGDAHCGQHQPKVEQPPPPPPIQPSQGEFPREHNARVEIRLGVMTTQDILLVAEDHRREVGDPGAEPQNSSIGVRRTGHVLRHLGSRAD